MSWFLIFSGTHSFITGSRTDISLAIDSKEVRVYSFCVFILNWQPRANTGAGSSATGGSGSDGPLASSQRFYSVFVSPQSQSIYYSAKNLGVSHSIIWACFFFPLINIAFISVRVLSDWLNITLAGKCFTFWVCCLDCTVLLAPNPWKPYMNRILMLTFGRWRKDERLSVVLKLW